MRVEVAVSAVRPNETSGFRGRKAILNHGLTLSLIGQPTSEDIKQHLKEAYQAELRRCVKVEVAVLGFRSLICLTVSVDVKQH